MTAIYEITPAGSGAELVDPLRYGTGPSDPAAVATPNAPTEIAFLKMRYKLPDEDVSQLIEMPVTPTWSMAISPRSATTCASRRRWRPSGRSSRAPIMAADELGRYRGAGPSGRGDDESGYRAEFMGLVKTASLLKPDAEIAVPAEGAVPSDRGASHLP